MEQPLLLVMPRPHSKPGEPCSRAIEHSGNELKIRRGVVDNQNVRSFVSAHDTATSDSSKASTLW